MGEYFCICAMFMKSLFACVEIKTHSESETSEFTQSSSSLQLQLSVRNKTRFKLEKLQEDMSLFVHKLHLKRTSGQPRLVKQPFFLPDAITITSLMISTKPQILIMNKNGLFICSNSNNKRSVCAHRNEFQLNSLMFSRTILEQRML